MESKLRSSESQKSGVESATVSSLLQKVSQGELGPVAALRELNSKKVYQINISIRSSETQGKWVFFAEAYLKNNCLLCFLPLPQELPEYLIWYTSLHETVPDYSDDFVHYRFEVNEGCKQESLF